MNKNSIFYTSLLAYTLSFVGNHLHAMERNLDLALINASGADDIKAIEKLIEEGAHVNAIIMMEGISPLTMAAFHNNRNAIKKLLEHNANVNLIDEDGHTPLWIAVNYSRPDIVALLISKGAQVNFSDRGGLTLLSKAASRCNPEILKILIAAGANVNPERQQSFPLKRALNTLIENPFNDPSKRDQCFRCIQILLDNGANPLLPNGFSALGLALGNRMVQDVLKIFLSKLTPAQLIAYDPDYPILMQSIDNRNLPVLVQLLAAGLDPSISLVITSQFFKDSRTYTALEYANNRSHHENIIKLLEQFKITPQETDRINTAMLTLLRADPTSSHDVRRILKSKIINDIVQEKSDRIKEALPPVEWNAIDKESLHKALLIAIKRALIETPAKKSDLTPMNTSDKIINKGGYNEKTQ